MSCMSIPGRWIYVIHTRSICWSDGESNYRFYLRDFKNKLLEQILWGQTPGDQSRWWTYHINEKKSQVWVQESYLEARLCLQKSCQCVMTCFSGQNMTCSICKKILDWSANKNNDLERVLTRTLISETCFLFHLPQVTGKCQTISTEEKKNAYIKRCEQWKRLLFFLSYQTRQILISILLY
jgi:hypothetical protein